VSTTTSVIRCKNVKGNLWRNEKYTSKIVDSSPEVDQGNDMQPIMPPDHTNHQHSLEHLASIPPQIFFNLFAAYGISSPLSTPSL